MHARHAPVAQLTPEQLEARRAADRRRQAAMRARRRAALAPDARKGRPVAQAEPERLEAPEVSVLLRSHGAPWRERHGLRLPPTAGQLDTLEARWPALGLADRVDVARAAGAALLRLRPRRRGEASWTVWRALLEAVDRIIADLRERMRAHELEARAAIVADRLAGRLMPAPLAVDTGPPADLSLWRRMRDKSTW